MNFLDFLIIAVLIVAIARGLLQGAVMQVFPFGGFWLGLLIGSAIAPAISGLFGTGASKAIASIVAVFGTAFIFSGVGRQVGAFFWRAIQRARLAPADAVLGALVAGIATLLGVWLIAMIFAGLPFRQITQPIHESAIVRSLERLLPPAPAIFSRVRQLIGADQFPDVFAGLEPQPDETIEVPSDPEVRAAVDAAGRATVKIVGTGCGGIKSGSGFVAARDLVVTNAHVIAGIRRPSVEDRDGSRRATPVVFDPDLDIAILRASRLDAGPLSLSGTLADRGTGGAVMGYPGGGPFRAGAAAVLNQFRATGRDIYGQGLTNRRVYQLDAQIRQGNSGGPFVRTDGVVLGVIFSASATEPDVGYAITSPDVNPRIQQAAAQQGAVDTGPCTA
jgi:S1-C subfamily serine protease